MKCETTNSVLTFVLGALVLLGVLFALQTFFLTRDLRRLGVQVATANSALAQMRGPAQALFNDVTAYNKKNPSPELTKLVEPPAKPAAK
jgi:hypothetical protein